MSPDEVTKTLEARYASADADAKLPFKDRRMGADFRRGYLQATHGAIALLEKMVAPTPPSGTQPDGHTVVHVGSCEACYGPGGYRQTEWRCMFCIPSTVLASKFEYETHVRKFHSEEVEG